MAWSPLPKEGTSNRMACSSLPKEGTHNRMVCLSLPKEVTDNRMACSSITKGVNNFSFFIEKCHWNATLFDNTVNEMHAMAFERVKGSNEPYTFNQARQEPDRKYFLDAMTKEVKDHS